MFHKVNIMKYIRLSRAQPNYTDNDNLANVTGIVLIDMEPKDHYTFYTVTYFVFILHKL